MAVIDVFSEDTMFYTDGKLKILSSFKITIVVGKYCKQQAKKKISELYKQQNQLDVIDINSQTHINTY